MLASLSGAEVQGPVFDVQKPGVGVQVLDANGYPRLRLGERQHGVYAPLSLRAHSMLSKLFAGSAICRRFCLSIDTAHGLFSAPLNLSGAVDAPTLAIVDKPAPPRVYVAEIIAVPVR